MTGQGRAYPIPADEPEPRFTRVALAVEEALAREGYPPLTARDRVELQQALFGFIHAAIAAAEGVGNRL